MARSGLHVLIMPVLTASRARPSKNLLGYEPFFQEEMQLDIITKKAIEAGYGTSRMWSLPEAGKEQVPIPMYIGRRLADDGGFTSCLRICAMQITPGSCRQ